LSGVVMTIRQFLFFQIIFYKTNNHQHRSEKRSLSITRPFWSWIHLDTSPVLAILRNLLLFMHGGGHINGPYDEFTSDFAPSPRANFWNSGFAYPVRSFEPSSFTTSSIFASEPRAIPYDYSDTESDIDIGTGNQETDPSLFYYFNNRDEETTSPSLVDLYESDSEADTTESQTVPASSSKILFNVSSVSTLQGSNYGQYCQTR